MLDFLCLGDVVYDVFVKPSEGGIVEVEKTKYNHSFKQEKICFNFGDKIVIDEVGYCLGGSACNVAVGMKKLGLDVGLAGYRGEDYYGQKLQEGLDEAGVNTDYFNCENGIDTSFSMILRFKGDRTIFTYRDKADYKKIKLAKAKKSNYLYIAHLRDGYEFIYKKAIELAKKKNVKIVLNPGKNQLKERKEPLINLLKLTEVLILNKEEAEILVGARFPLRMNDLFYKLSDFGVKTVAITNGRKGAYARGEDRKIYHEKIVDVESVESTGAGDAFSAGFLTKYIEDGNIEEALKWGVVNGGYVTREIGAQNGLLTRQEIENKVK